MNQFAHSKHILHCLVVSNVKVLQFLLLLVSGIYIKIIWIVGNLIIKPLFMVSITEGYVEPGCDNNNKKKIGILFKTP